MRKIPVDLKSLYYGFSLLSTKRQAFVSKYILPESVIVTFSSISPLHWVHAVSYLFTVESYTYSSCVVNVEIVGS